MACKVRVILASGNEFVMECEVAKMTYSNKTGELTNFHYEGCTNNRPLYLDLEKVVAVIEEKREDGIKNS